MSLREELREVDQGIPQARKESFASHPLAIRIRKQWRNAVDELIPDSSFKVVGSPGKGRWAATVWLGVFDPMVTDSAERGCYAVYLVSQDGKKIFLSLNQGTTEIHELVGGGKYLKALSDTAIRDVGLLAGKNTAGLVDGPIALGGRGMLTRGYEAGNILAFEYETLELPSDQALADDLLRMLDLYGSLVEGRDQVDEDPVDDSGPSSIIEARRYRWHRRAERSRSLAEAAKRIHGTACQVEACSKDLADVYGEVGAGYIEAHHLVPFSNLEGRPTELDPKNDFAVVCPDCHRIIHRRGEPYSLGEVSEMLASAGRAKL